MTEQHTPMVQIQPSLPVSVHDESDVTAQMRRDDNQPRKSDVKISDAVGQIHNDSLNMSRVKLSTSAPLSSRRSGNRSDPLKHFPGVALTSVLVFLLLYLPMLLVVIYSFNGGSQALLWRGFSFKWYAEVFTDGSILAATRISLEVAGAATILSTVFGTLFILGADHLSRAGFAIGNGLINASLVIPEIVLGVSTMSFIRLIGLPQGMIPLILAHTTFCIPFVAMPIRARIQTLDHSCFEAAEDLGASQVQTVLKITMPLLTPAIISGALMAFVISMDDYLISNYLTSAGTTTLPIYIFSLIRKGANPSINVVSTMLLLLAVFVTVISSVLTISKTQRNKKIYPRDKRDGK